MLITQRSRVRPPPWPFFNLIYKHINKKIIPEYFFLALQDNCCWEQYFHGILILPLFKVVSFSADREGRSPLEWCVFPLWSSPDSSSLIDLAFCRHEELFSFFNQLAFANSLEVISYFVFDLAFFVDRLRQSFSDKSTCSHALCFSVDWKIVFFMIISRKFDVLNLRRIFDSSPFLSCDTHLQNYALGSLFLSSRTPLFLDLLKSYSCKRVMKLMLTRLCSMLG